MLCDVREQRQHNYRERRTQKKGEKERKYESNAFLDPHYFVPAESGPKTVVGHEVRFRDPQGGKKRKKKNKKKQRSNHGRKGQDSK